MSATLDRRIRSELEAHIRSGEWPPGHRIPFEHELVAHYGCSRATVNKAVSALVSAGLIERRKRAGSFVAQPRVHAAMLEIPDIRSVVRDRGETYAFDRLALRTGAPSPLWKSAAPALRGKAVIVEGVHRAAGRALAYEWREISLAAVPQAGATDFIDEPPGSWLLRHIPWTEARHRIAAINPEPAVAQALGIAPATACLLLERWTWQGATPITFARQIFHGDRFDLIGSLAPAPHG